MTAQGIGLPSLQLRSDERKNVERKFSTRARLAALAAAIVAVTGLAVGGPAIAAGPSNPQASQPNADVPDRCVLQQQSGIAGGLYAKTNNAPNTVTVTGWQVVPCTVLTINVDRGERAGLDLRFSGEFDASGPAGNTGWVQSRIWVTPGAFGSISTREPDNTDRGDSFALDNSQGLTGDWSAHIQEQSAMATCSTSAPASGCSFRVYAQVQLTAGATSVWIDDTNLTVDVRDQTYWGVPTRELSS